MRIVKLFLEQRIKLEAANAPQNAIDVIDAHIERVLRKLSKVKATI